MRSEKFYIVGGDRNPEKAILSFWSADVTGGSKPTNSKASNARPWFEFGKKNQLPQELLQLVWDNSTKPALLDKAASFIVGKGVQPYINRVVDNQPSPEMVDDVRWKQFRKRHKVDTLLMRVALNLVTLGNAAIEVVLDEDLERIHTLTVHDFTKVRCERIGDSGVVEHYYLCADWRNAKYVPDNEAEGNVFRVPAWDEKEPLKHPKSIIHVKKQTVGNDYYGLPLWYGTRAWLRLSNQIPLWHLHGMRNGYNIRWHVQIPESYFDRYDTEEKKKAAKEELQKSMGDWLEGVENVGKALISFFEQDEAGKAMDGWKVEPLSFDLHDEAFVALFEQSEMAVASGSGIDPTLAGITMPNKMGAGSGSEKRYSYQLHVILNTVLERGLLSDLLENISLMEGWPEEWEWSFIDYDLTTLDKLKTGMQPVVTTQ